MEIKLVESFLEAALMTIWNNVVYIALAGYLVYYLKAYFSVFVF
jgi:hypothetical protein